VTLYRLLLLLYPRSFRRRYGGEMSEAFASLVERTREERGAVAVAALWGRTTVDAVLSGTKERLFGTTPKEEEEEGMARIWFHISHAARSLRRAPGYTLAFALTLGLAIGVNSAVFSIVNGVLLQPLPVEGAERILYLKQPIASTGTDNALFSFVEVDDYRSASRTIDEFVEYGDWEFTVLDEEEPHRAIGGLVTSNYFSVLGMHSALGRILNDADDAEGAEPVLLLTDAYWERAFGRDPSVIGKILDLENLSVRSPFLSARVVGVLEPGLYYSSSRRPDFYANYAANGHYQSSAMLNERWHRMTDLFARVAPGVSIDAARDELRSIATSLHDQYPDEYQPDMGYGLEAVRWQDELTRQGRSIFLFLMGTVALILVLAAANVTNLTLTRLIRRERELSTRAALGATGADLRLHLTFENAVLGLLGGGLGIVLAYLSRSSLVAYVSRYTVRAQEVGVDWVVLGVTLGGGMALAALLAWMPGLPVVPGTSTAAATHARVTDTRWRRTLQRGLVVSQLALSFMLLTGAGLLVRSLLRLTSVDPGFRTEQVLAVATPTGPFGSGLPMVLPGETEDWMRTLDEIRAFPGVRSAAVASWAPLSDHADPTLIGVMTDVGEDELDHSHPASYNNVSPGYFATLGIPLIAGRDFEDTDRDAAPDVVILNQSMARAHFGDVDPIGHKIAFEGDQTMEPSRWYEIVGVVADSREYGMDQEGVHTFYRPAAKVGWGTTIVVAQQGDPRALTQRIRDIMRETQPHRAVEGVRTMASLVDEDVAPSRLNAVLFGSFSVLALAIAALGVLSTVAFSVSQRIREFGIRIALGADRARVLRNVLAEGGALVGVAFVLGVGGSLLLGRFVGGLLFDVQPADPASLVVAAVTLGVVALLASLMPALRATRVHPSEALRAD
jgi:putative ABC transport system permease protein